MIELIIGDKGKGKTRKMVNKAINESKITNGSIIYIDKSNKHMYELSNSITLINLDNFDINTKEAFSGFIQGLISSNHDLTHIYMDNFMRLAKIDESTLSEVLFEMDKISNKYQIMFVISTSVNEISIPDEFKKNIICKL